ncbi:class I SAM-dependent methyltransferase [Streptomyces sp. NRRL WC-3618]|uniref:class I SAM-dependent methyltransferase n=1 Tax=Streptomyces sp. NRRL WC-3618 TaxID=1519490 RepID=UPI0006AFA9E9|nr:class I SAM-dependent methyltransferase [Streptomyces sp. NRRL WC-3618]
MSVPTTDQNITTEAFEASFGEAQSETAEDEYRHEAELYDVLWADLNTLDLPFQLARTEEFGGPLLELACGTGRVLLPCAELVERAVGVDISPSMLEQGRAALAAADLPEGRVELVEGDFRTFRLGEKFALVLAAGQPMYHLETTEDWLSALTSIREHLQPGGRFATGVPIFSDEVVAEYDRRQLFAGEIRHPRTGQRIAMWDFNTFDTAAQKITRRRVSEVLDEEGLVLESRHSLRTNYYRSPEQIRELLGRAGFRIDREHGGFDESPFEPGSEYYVWVASAAE